MQRCGFCSVVSGALRRVMCVGSRRDSSESYYRELGDQDTLKIEDRSSDLSDDVELEEETSLCRRCRKASRGSPRSSPRASPRTSPGTSPRPSRRASPRTSPRSSRKGSSQTSPRASRRASPRTSPQPSRKGSSQTSPRPSRQASPRTSPRPSRQASPRTSPRSSRKCSSQTSLRPSRRASPRPTPWPSRKASLQTTPRPSRQTYLTTSPRPSRKVIRKGSPMPSRQATLTTFKRPSRKTSLQEYSRPFWQIPETSPGPSQQAQKTSPSPGPSRETQRKTSLRRYRQASLRTDSLPSRRTALDISPQSSSSDTSPVSSLPTSPKISPCSSRRSSSSSTWNMIRSWLRYSKGSRLYYLHSDVATDSMEERDPPNYVMKMKEHPSGRFLTVHKRRKKKLITRSLSENNALLDDMMLGQVQCILNQSVEWKFNAFTLETVSGGRCLPVLCVHLFQMYGLLGHFKLDATKAWKLFSLIEEGYHSFNPYHNSIHAADVTQAMHCFLQQDRIQRHLTPTEILASLLAAIAHDMDHPGVNQPFLIATRNHLAALYKNTSVLENHHWRSAMSCLIESGFLEHLPPDPGLRESLMDQISSLILATDITRQAEYLTNFKTHLDENTLDMTNIEHRHLVLQIALKCADISNPCRPWEISRKWSLKVCEEFFRQGDFERRLNLPVTALCDRHTTSIPKIQTGFFKFVVTPLISEWHRFLQNDLSNQMLRNLIYNQKRWEILMNEEANEETKTETSDADLADDDAGADNDSRKLLLAPRRASLNPPPKNKSSFKNQFRRFSVPLNVFQDVTYRHRDMSRDSSVMKERAPQQHSADGSGSQPSLHSQLSVRGHCSHSEEGECHLNAETLLPDSTIASITTPAQALRLHTVLREGGNLNKPVSQITFPPLASTSRDLSPAARAVPSTSRDYDSLSQFRPVPSTSTQEPKYNYLVVRDVKKTDCDLTSDTSVEVAEPPRNVQKANSVAKSSRKESSTVGSQLRDNLTWMPLELESDPLLQRRRKSMPAESGELLPIAPREKKIREVPTVLPQIVQRTFSSMESWTKRRGSAPSPVAPSELRGLTSLGSVRHSANGSRRKPSLTVTCQQYLARTPYSVQERTQFPRRSSLPVEVMTGISTH